MTYSTTFRSLCAALLLTASSGIGHAQGMLSTWVGNGVTGYSGDNGLANAAELNHPYGITFDGAGNFFIADQGNNVIRRVDAITGIITTYAGTGNRARTGDGGQANAADLGELYHICVDGANNLYLTDWTASVVRKIDAATGVITTIAGNGTPGYSGDNGLAVSAQLHQPEGLCVYGNNLYITDKIKNCIRKVDLTTNIITTIAGNGVYSYSGDGGQATAATFKAPSSICADVQGNLYIADEENLVIRKINSATGIISTIAGTGGVYGFAGNGGAATSATLGYVQGVCVDQFNNIYINDASCSCRKIKASNGTIDIVAGSDTVDGYGGDGGYATAGLLNNPSGACIDPVTGTIVIADYSNMRIRRATQPGFFGTTGVMDPANGVPLMYPNPSTGRLYVQLPQSKTNATVDVMNMAGEKTRSYTLTSNVNTVDMSDLAGGNYIVTIRIAGGNAFTRKITLTK